MNTNQTNINPKKLIQIITKLILIKPHITKLTQPYLLSQLRLKIYQNYHHSIANVKNSQLLYALRKAINNIQGSSNFINKDEFSDKQDMTEQIDINNPILNDQIDHLPLVDFSQVVSNSAQQINNTSFIYCPETIITQKETILSITGISNHHSQMVDNTSNNYQQVITPNIPTSTQSITPSILQVSRQNQQQVVTAGLRLGNQHETNLLIYQQNIHQSIKQKNPFEKKVLRLLNNQLRSYRWDLIKAKKQAPKSQQKITGFFTLNKKSSFQLNNTGRVAQNKQTSNGLIKMRNIETQYFVNGRKDLEVIQFKCLNKSIQKRLNQINNLQENVMLNELTGLKLSERKTLYNIHLQKNKLIRNDIESLFKKN